MVPNHSIDGPMVDNHWMVPWRKNITISWLEKNYHCWSLPQKYKCINAHFLVNMRHVVYIALWAKLLRKWEIGKFNKITSWPLIFCKLYYFRWICHENVTFTFYFLSFASNFPCKILWNNKNIDANISIFQIPFSQCWGPRRKKLFWGFFLSIKKSACVPNLKFLRHQQQVFCQ